MDVHLSLAGKGDLSERIYRQLVEAIVDGRLRNGQRLPPTRELARQLQVARNTVSIAYERLAAEGFTASRVGSGTYVTTPSLRQSRIRQAPSGAGIDVQPFWRSRRPITQPFTQELRYNFGPGVADESRFPWEIWKRIVTGVFQDRAMEGFEYASPAGYFPLRRAIARHVGIARSVHAGAEDVIVTNGSQHALDLIARVLIGPGMAVAVENPGYFPVHQLLASHGARVVGIPVDDEGMVVSEIPDDVRLVYATPSHQFPLGMPMSLRRRSQLLNWADDHNAVIIEDDYDSEFRFDERSLDPLQSLDRSGRVIYVGTFSKTLMPSLRLGFMVPPKSLTMPILAARQLSDWHSELSVQMSLTEFLDQGHFARHLRKNHRVYAERHQVMSEALEEHLSPWFSILTSMAGLHLCAVLRAGTTAHIERITDRAMEQGILLRPLDYCYLDTPVQSGFVIGFGNIETENIEPGIVELADLTATELPIQR